MPKRRTRVPEDVEQRSLFPGDVAIRPRRAPARSSRPSCAETGHTWARVRLFGLPPDEIVCCPVYEKLFR